MSSAPGPRAPILAPDTRPNVIAAGFGLAALGIFTFLYVLYRDVYFSTIDLWSFPPYEYPFLDLVYIPDLVKCWGMGVNVYIQNPCDPLGRVHDYSPLWLRMSWLADWVPFTNPIGLAMDALYMLSLALLPRPRCKGDYLPLLLAVISPMTAFALERGNVDVLMYLFAIMAVVCMDYALPFRMLGYVTILIAGLLKFYPFVLFILLLRERVRLMLPIAAIALCVMAGVIWAYHDEVKLMLANVPQPRSFAVAFGAAQLPAAIGILAQDLLNYAGLAEPASEPFEMQALVGLPMTALVVVVTWGVARCVSIREDFQMAVRALTQRESLALVAGAVLVCGCFLSGRSIGYREIILLLALTGLSALARTSPTAGLRKLFLGTVWNVVFLLSYVLPQRLIFDSLGSVPAGSEPLISIGFLLVREACWWWLIAMLAAVLMRFVTDSQTVLELESHPWLARMKRLVV